MVGDSSKRRSMLFPFRSGAKQETKFEVVNRKKSPLTQSHTAPSPFDSPSSPAKPKSVIPQPRSSTSSPTPFNDVSSRVLQEHQLKSQKNTHLIKSSPLKKTTETKSKNDEEIRPADVGSNLRVTGDLPPVPDYNSKVFAPPITIQGRSVSLTKQTAPPRRKPPTLKAVLDDQVARSEESLLSSQISSQQSVESNQYLTSTITKESEHDVPKVPNLADNIISNQIPKITVQSPSSLEKAENFEQDLLPVRQIVVSEPLSERSSIIETHSKEADDDILQEHTHDINNSENVQPSKPSVKQSSVAQTPTLQNSVIQKPVEELFNTSAPVLETPTLSFPDYPAPVIKTSDNQSNLESTDTIATDHSIDSQSVKRALTKTTTGEESEGIPGSFSFPINKSQPKLLDDDFDDLRQPSSINDERPLSYISQQSEFYDAEEGFKSSHSLPKSTKYFESDQDDNQILEAANSSYDIYNGINYNHSQDFNKSADAEGEISSTTSSIIVKPLTFHKKTLSTPVTDKEKLPDFAIPPTQGKGHEKKLSLSDELIRDIEQFRPEVRTYAYEDDDYEASPISPLRTENTSRHLLEDEFEDESELRLPQKRLEITNLSEQDIFERNEKTALFHDSSDEEIHESSFSHEPDQSPFNHKFQNDSDLSNGSSTNAQINYTSKDIPIRASHGAYKDDNESIGDENTYPYEANEVVSNDLVPEQNHLFASSNQMPRSSSFQNLTRQLSSSDQSSTQPSSFRPQSIGDSSLIKDENSQYSFNGPIEASPDTNDLASERDSGLGPAFSSPLQNPGLRTFHVVNDGNYSEDSDEISFDEDGEDQFNNGTVVRQENLKFDRELQSDDEGDDEGAEDPNDVLSFTAKSPIQPDFTFEQFQTQNASDIDLSTPADSLNFQNDSSPRSNAITDPEKPLSANKLMNNYDRREETIAPVTYIGKFHGKTRRPPPSTEAPNATRVARSASVSQPLPDVYDSIEKDIKVTSSQNLASHIPEKSGYVEALRFGAGTTNSAVPSTKWTLPIGISGIDHSKLASSVSKASYRRVRTTKVDLKHGKIKPRLLASEVDDEDESTGSLIEIKDSMELERLKTHNSQGSFSQSYASLSPRKEQSVARSGTLLYENVKPQVRLGRSGTVLDGSSKRGMTLFIANPDSDSD